MKMNSELLDSDALRRKPRTQIKSAQRLRYRADIGPVSYGDNVWHSAADNEWNEPPNQKILQELRPSVYALSARHQLPPKNQKPSAITNGVLMLGQRRRRWANIKTTLV